MDYMRKMMSKHLTNHADILTIDTVGRDSIGSPRALGSSHGGTRDFI